MVLITKALFSFWFLSFEENYLEYNNCQLWQMIITCIGEIGMTQGIFQTMGNLYAFFKNNSKNTNFSRND
jgi:hypothetical protein